ncbi:hypothetical protein GCM10009630_16800 [Kribbella jejuensis]|uniref:Uncharacterized protein n=1 Tax=Kribbella jejuensis TaxID=236068 RepID=A0A542EBB8_9ACTN|nr:hypothetical protein FB475_5558 [Kribbella jejuensis]
MSKAEVALATPGDGAVTVASGAGLGDEIVLTHLRYEAVR